MVEDWATSSSEHSPQIPLVLGRTVNLRSALKHLPILQEIVRSRHVDFILTPAQSKRRNCENVSEPPLFDLKSLNCSTNFFRLRSINWEGCSLKNCFYLWNSISFQCCHFFGVLYLGIFPSRQESSPSVRPVGGNNFPSWDLKYVSRSQPFSTIRALLPFKAHMFI